MSVGEWVRTGVELVGLVADVISSAQDTRQEARRLRLEVQRRHREMRAYAEHVRRGGQP